MKVNKAVGLAVLLCGWESWLFVEVTVSAAEENQPMFLAFSPKGLRVWLNIQGLRHFGVLKVEMRVGLQQRDASAPDKTIIH